MNHLVALCAVSAFIGFAIGWLAKAIEPAAVEPNEHEVNPL